MTVEGMSLEALASKIPEMGGRRIGEFLRRNAATRSHGDIVELGCWLGAGTAQMALGLLDAGKSADVSIHCYDNFHTSASSAEKAVRQGVELSEGQDTLPLVKKALAPFGDNIHLHKGMLDASTEWCGKPISLYVDDASKYPFTFYQCLKIFGPHWIPGTTIVVLMDYYLFRKQKPDVSPRRVANLRCQYDFIQANPENFVSVDELEDGTCAAFRYMSEIDFAALPMPEKPVPKSLRTRSS